MFVIRVCVCGGVIRVCVRVSVCVMRVCVFVFGLNVIYMFHMF